MRTVGCGWRTSSRKSSGLFRADAPVAERCAVIDARLPSATHRIVPTTLGSTLRSGEDQLIRDSEENLEEFVLRRYQQMSSELKAQHRRFRSQLNIYCLLTLVFLGLAVLSAG